MLLEEHIMQSTHPVIKGWVTAVKNQGSCGSCAAFAAHAQHETTLVKAGATLSGMDLSEQHLIDCGYNQE